MERGGGRTVLCRDWGKLDGDALFSDVGEVNWSSLLAANNMDDKIQIFTSKLMEILNKHAPLKKRHFKNFPAPCRANGACEVWNGLRHLDLIKVKNSGARLSHTVEELNAFFVGDGRTWNIDDLWLSFSELLNGHYDTSFHWKYVPPLVVRKAIIRTTSNAVGLDGISTSLMEIGAHLPCSEGQEPNIGTTLSTHLHPSGSVEGLAACSL
ncbi:rna-directed dna polymerase from mobile element jockey-like protein [Lasius niger]|uniref:Rna-directed dna polymerase from mobile element jockey-like protein n=1 Tax=Lasius niger TaxID=67767 RepID=A0A0J7K292_LASNI|nr:rna-directed dna polymerase from mobile element jockey-like protein [Lasius niger]